MNICYEVTAQMKAAHEIFCNLIQRIPQALSTALDKWIAGSIAQCLFPYEISYIITLSDRLNQPSGSKLAAMPSVK